MSDDDGDIDSKPLHLEKRRKNTKLDDLKLIQLVKSYKALYEADDEDYHNQVRREEIWHEIGKQMGRKMDECRRRWYNLRDCYRKSVLKRKATKGEFSKHWRYDKELDFMEPHLKGSKPRKKLYYSNEEYQDEDPIMASADIQSYEENETYSPQEVVDTFDETNSRIPESDAGAASDLHEILQDLVAWRREEQQTKSDHIGTYFKSIEETVRTFPLALQVEAKKQISSLVFDLELRASNNALNNM